MKQDKYSFDSRMRSVGQFAQTISNDAIKNEPMFFNASAAFAYENGGPITRSFISNLPLGDRLLSEMVFDSRSHMLMPGWYPAIPGYHHDDVPRPPIPVGQHFATSDQPDYDTPRYRSKHIMGLVNGDICPTEYLNGAVELPGVPDEELIYRQWHAILLEKIAEGIVDPRKVLDRHLYYFNDETFHQATKCVKNGWRWFGRVSWDTDRVNTITNEFRQQTQVYLEFPMEGW